MDYQPDAQSDRYYAFHDPVSNMYYFHNPIRNEVTWTEPEQAKVFDGITLQPFHGGTRTPGNISCSHSGDIIPIPSVFMEVGKPRGRVRRQRQMSHDFTGDSIVCSRPSGGRRISTLHALFTPAEVQRESHLAGTGVTDIPAYFPDSIVGDKNLVNVTEWARQFIAVRKSSSRKKKGHMATAEALLSFDDSFANIPLLNYIEKQTKNAVKLFSYALSYGKRKHDKPVSFYVDIIWNNRDLIDEAFVQLIKLMTNNPNNESLFRIWELMIILCSLFLPSPKAVDFVKQFLAGVALDSNKEAAKFAQLSYLRLQARLLTKSCVEKLPEPFILSGYPGHVNECRSIMGITLWELMWRQRRDRPKMRIPVFLYELLEALIKKGAFESAETFTYPGNKKRIEEMVHEFDTGCDVCTKSTLLDLASLFKRWIQKLPMTLIPFELQEQIIAEKETKNFIPIVEGLTPVDHDIVAYIVGFLRDYVSHQPTTRNFICMTFGSTFIRFDNSNPLKAKVFLDLSKDFMMCLIDSLNVSCVYPLDQSTLTQ